MKYRPDQTPAQHVAQREALAKMQASREFTPAWDFICNDIILPIGRIFVGGQRLGDKAFPGFVGLVREKLTGLGPVALREANRPATRTRPKGEEHEFTVLFRNALDTGDPRDTHEFVGGRIWLSRRRIEASYETNGIGVTRHLMERSIERDLASWTGRLGEVETALLDNIALATLWKRIIDTGRTTNARLALPFGDGLMLGRVEERANVGASCTFSLRERACPPVEREQFGYNLAPAAWGRGNILVATASTVVGEGALRLEQMDLRDALQAFKARHKELLHIVKEGVFWADARLTPVPSFAEMGPGIDAACAELATLLAYPRFREGLDGRDGPIPLEDTTQARDAEAPRM